MTLKLDNPPPFSLGVRFGSSFPAIDHVYFQVKTRDTALPRLYLLLSFRVEGAGKKFRSSKVFIISFFRILSCSVIRKREK